MPSENAGFARVVVEIGENHWVDQLGRQDSVAPLKPETGTQGSYS